jgi:hypothetical protein
MRNTKLPKVEWQPMAEQSMAEQISPQMIVTIQKIVTVTHEVPVSNRGETIGSVIDGLITDMLAQNEIGHSITVDLLPVWSKL